MPKDLNDLKLLAPNRRVKTELEVVFNVKPEDYDKYVHFEISVDDARTLIEKLYKTTLPNRIYDIEDAKRIIEETKKMDILSSEVFYTEAMKLKLKK